MEQEERGNETVFIPLEEIVSIRWSVDRGKRLGNLRGNTSQEKLAETLGRQGIQVSRQYIQKLESAVDVRGVPPEILKGLCKALNVSLSELLGGKSAEILRLMD